MADSRPATNRNGPVPNGPNQNAPVQNAPVQDGTAGVLRRHWPLALIIGGLLVWGLFHAVGAYLSLAQRPGWSYQSAGASEIVRQQEAAQPTRRDPRKALLVGVCSAGFVGFWLLALVAAHRRRLRAAEQAALLAEQQLQADLEASVTETADNPSATGEAPAAGIPRAAGGRQPTSAGGSG
jgi:hypothetical protein